MKILPASLALAFFLSAALVGCGDDEGEVARADQPASSGTELWPQGVGPANPHAGMMGGDPHAAMGGMDPHAAMGGDPHAMGGMDPHAAMGGDPHAMGGDPHAMGGDPHAMGGGAPAQGGGTPSASGSAGGVRWEAPAAFRPAPASSNMRIAQYVFEEGGAPAELVVYYFGPGQGGSVQANVERWVNQFRQPDGRSSMEAADITRREVNGTPVTLVDVSGAFDGAMGPGQAGAEQRMLGAVAEGARGPVFFKMVGPAAQMAAAKPHFDRLVQSLGAG